MTQWAFEILKQYGLAGLVIGALAFVCWRLGSRLLAENTRLTEQLLAAHIARIEDLRAYNLEMRETLQKNHEMVESIERSILGGTRIPKL